MLRASWICLYMKQPKVSEPKVGCAFPMDGTGNFPAALEF
jgi:hypothetical protein